MAARKKHIDFEKNLGELESLVETLEKGDLPLEEALKTFEKGVKLTRDCQQALKEAEQKVAVLLQSEEGLQEVPLESDPDPQ